MKISDLLKTVLIGKSRDISDQRLFHKISLIALFAWVALGADGITSSCYGPEAAFLALQGHTYLSLFVAFATVVTIIVVCASYSQIIELFPAGGGGYLVASKLLSPNAGVVAGCALLIDYVLTITVSIASGADALFSMLPPEWASHKLSVALGGVILLSLLNLRGVKESVWFCLPIFALFIITHAVAILFVLFTQGGNLPVLANETVREVRNSHAELGLLGMFLLILKAYSAGAGTYTGIEAVSNALPILREPKIETGKTTMMYMAISLAVTVAGLMVGYLLFHVTPQAGKTLNAVFFETMSKSWPQSWAHSFVFLTLISEAGLLFIAAQAGFVGGPQILANMALDRWFPTRFAMLSDRFVTQNGVILMGGAALVVMLFSHGSVALLVVLYSINVFITFSLSQLGMVKHWWQNRHTLPIWKKKILVNGIGLSLTTFILVSLSFIKFWEGGWITLVVTGALILFASLIKRHYYQTLRDLKRLDDLVVAVELSPVLSNATSETVSNPPFDPKAKTAVLLVNGFNGLGLHTLFSVLRMFPGVFKNFVIVQVGQVDAGNFKGSQEVANLSQHVQNQIAKYLQYLRAKGFFAEGMTGVGTDVVAKVAEIAPQIIERFPQAVFFGGQLVFQNETILTRFLHNYAVFAIQRRFYQQGLPLLILPIRV